VVICLFLASGGVYYAFFACFFFFLAGTEACFHKKSRRPFAAAGILIGVVVFGLFVNGLPALIYRLGHGANPNAVARGSFESEYYGLKITQLLLPIREHRIHQLARFRESYHQTAPLNNENESSSLGLVGSLGFLGLLSVFLLRRRVDNRDTISYGLGLLTVGAVLLASVGGLGSLFSCLAARWLRGYNRISVFIAFFALFGVVLFLDRLKRAFVTSWKSRLLYHGLLMALLVIGLMDQTSPGFAPYHAQLKAAFQSDAAFIADIENRLPENALVFQLPYVPFPEGCSANRKLSYDHLRGYLHSRSLRWSYAAMKGRPGDCWQRQLAGRPTIELLSVLAFAEFDGIFLDRLGFDDQGRELECQITTALGVGPLVSPDGRFSFFNLMSYREQLKHGFSAAEWQSRHQAALDPPV
jgi:phosphoglycerol transferase